MTDHRRDGDGDSMGGGVVRFGPDRVEIHESRVVIHSPVDMDRWDVVEYRKPLIHFDDRTWTLVRKDLEGSGLIRYELGRWQPAGVELHGHEIHYGLEFVEARTRDLQSQRRIAWETSALRLLSPLAGFLFARSKGRLEDRLGITAVTMTWRSVILEYLIILAAAVYATIGMNATFSYWLMKGDFTESIGGVAPAAILAVVLLPDAIMRWSRLLGEDRRPPGFYEWLWRPMTRE
jgi:hypothetical protein